MIAEGNAGVRRRSGPPPAAPVPTDRRASGAIRAGRT